MENRSALPVSFAEALLILAIVSPVIAFQLTYALCVLIYLYALSVRWVLADLRSGLRFLPLFSAFSCFSLLFAIVHGREFANPGFERTLDLLLVFPVSVMLIDAVVYLREKKGVSIERHASFALYLIFVLILARMIYRYFDYSGDFFGDFFSLDARRSPISSYNPNHADNYYIYTLLISTYFYSASVKLGVLPSIVYVFICALFGFLFVQAGSIGSVIGIVAAAVVIGSIWSFAGGVNLRRLSLVAGGTVVIMAAGYLLAATGNDLRHRVSATLDQVVQLQGDLRSGEAVARCDADSPGTPPVVNENYAQNPSFAYRVIIYQASVALWMERPFLGNGVYADTGSQTLRPFACVFGNFAHAHNLYLDLLGRGGLLLFAWFLAVFLATGYLLLKNAARSDDRGEVDAQMQILSALVAAYFVYALTENLFDLTFIYAAVLKAVLFGMIVLWAAGGPQAISYGARKTSQPRP